MRDPARPPCIVCGKRRHDAAVHEEHRRQRARTCNLLQRRWPALRGLAAVMAFYARQEPPRPAPAAREEWACKVLRSGQVVHVRVEQEGSV